MKKSLFSYRGFTLIELLVVIALISILSASAVAIINPSSRIKSARDASRKTNLAQIVTGLSSYFAQKLYYPSAPADLVPGELKAIPLNPSGQSFGYKSLTEGDSPCTTAAGNCHKVVIYDLYEVPNVACPSGTTAYLSWTSDMIGLAKICSAGTPTPNDLQTPD